MKDILALTGALLVTFSTLPYLVDIARRKTKPNIVSWLTWTILTAIATAAAFAAHEPKTALLTLGGTICTAAVVILGLKYGIAKFSRFDIFCQIGAVLGLIGWLAFDSPALGVIIPLIIDFIGALPTIRHSWLKPLEETWQTFLIGVIASALTLASLTRFNIVSLLYPVYLLIANGVLVLIILYRRRQLGLSFVASSAESHKTLYQ